MKKKLITGGAGFIGFHLAKCIYDDDCELTLIDDLSRGNADDEFQDFISKNNVSFINADMTKTDFFKDLDDYYDEIYHLVAINGTKNFYLFPENVLRVNILSIMNILEWVNKDRCGKFLFSSSSEVYAGTIEEYLNDGYIPTKEDIPLTINDIFNPRFSYGGSKIIGELLTINMLKSKDVKFSIVRYHNIYGSRMGYDHVIPEFCQRIHEKMDPFPIFGGYETRAFCHVFDAVNATKLVMKSDKTNGEILHIGNSDEEVSIIEVAKHLFNISGINPKLDIREAPLGSVKRRCPNTNKIEKLIKYKPEISLKNGLVNVYKWYMEDIDKKDVD
ncbi:MAG: NAD-dependent epimerase/dehydratase family protein [Methanobrevibacter sp.]|jgi:nucleoside-diphosphate-sugar epimerase|nr:NAD-dependent epimerase/dehydratase family protein [Candidatus Methanovirga basalitermitum]